MLFSHYFQKTLKEGAGFCANSAQAYTSSCLPCAASFEKDQTEEAWIWECKKYCLEAADWYENLKKRCQKIMDWPFKYVKSTS